MNRSGISYLKEIEKFNQEYLESLKICMRFNDYCDFTTENVENLVLNPYRALCELHLSYFPQEIISIASNPEFSKEKLPLQELFDIIQDLPNDVVMSVFSNIDGNPCDIEDVLESVKNKNFIQFKELARTSSLDFNLLNNTFYLIYAYKTENDERDLLGYKSADSLDEKCQYYFFKDKFFEDLRFFEFVKKQLQKNYKPDEIGFVLKFIEEIRNKVCLTFPDINNFNDETYVKWLSSYYEYYKFLIIMVSTHFLWIGPSSVLLERIAWHPCVIGYRLKWSNLILTAPVDMLMLKPDFYSNIQSSDSDEFFISISPNFINSGIESLSRFMELCPLNNYSDNYITFVYRITGRMRPKQEELNTNILYEEAAPYIYYFIKGITVEDPKHPEDVYGKMKRFFTTTNFPADEKDILEPCDAWKEALAELYPTIFLFNNKQYISNEDNESGKTLEEDILIYGNSEYVKVLGNKIKGDYDWNDAKNILLYNSLGTLYDKLVSQGWLADGYRNVFIFRLSGFNCPKELPKIVYLTSVSRIGYILRCLCSNKKEDVPFKILKTFFTGENEQEPKFAQSAKYIEVIDFDNQKRNLPKSLVEVVDILNECGFINVTEFNAESQRGEYKKKNK